MKKYNVIINFLIGTELVELRYYDVETITYYSEKEITIANDEMLSKEIPLQRHLYLRGDINASVNGSKIVSICVLQSN